MDDKIEKIIDEIEEIDPESYNEIKHFDEEIEIENEEFEVETTQVVYTEPYTPESGEEIETHSTEKILLDEEHLLEIEINKLPECPVHKGRIEAGEKAIRQCSECGTMMCQMCAQECRDCKKHLCHNCWSTQGKRVYLCSNHAP